MCEYFFQLLFNVICTLLISQRVVLSLGILFTGARVSDPVFGNGPDPNAQENSRHELKKNCYFSGDFFEL